MSPEKEQEVIRTAFGLLGIVRTEEFVSDEDLKFAQKVLSLREPEEVWLARQLAPIYGLSFDELPPFISSTETEAGA